MSLAEAGFAPTIEQTKLPEQKSFAEKAEGVVDALKYSPSLFELKRQGKSTKEAIETTALSFAESEDQDFSESEKNLFGVIAHLGSFVTSQRRADEFGEKREERRLSDRERAEMTYMKKHDLIPFNHAIKELINTDSSLTKDELDKNLAQLYMRLFYLDDPIAKRSNNVRDEGLIKKVRSDALTSISVSTNGMRHEIAAESMLSAAGIDYEYDIDTEEDEKGADMFVYIDGRWEYIDIKASEMSATKALSKRSDSHAVWTGLNQSNFKGAKDNQVNGLRISFNQASDYADAFVQRIRSVVRR